MKSTSVMSEQLFGRINVCGLSFLRSVVQAEVIVLSVVLNLCFVLFQPWNKANPTNAGLAVVLSAFVFVILLSCHLAKIADAVVQLVSVDVVDEEARKVSVLNQPHKSVRCVFFAAKLNVPVPLWSNRSCDFSDLDLWPRHLLKKRSGFSNVLKALKDKFAGNACVHVAAF